MAYGPRTRAASLPPHAPAACTEERQRGQPWRRSGSPATEPSGHVTKLDPLDRLQPTPAAHWAYEGLGGAKFRPLPPLFAQLLRLRSRPPSFFKPPSQPIYTLRYSLLYLLLAPPTVAPPTLLLVPPLTAISPYQIRISAGIRIGYGLRTHDTDYGFVIRIYGSTDFTDCE
jgi:hypothetical protein